MKESSIQIQICEMLSAHGIFYFSIPNERWGLSHAQRTQLKKMGLTPGMPDLCVLHDGGVCFLEVKTEIGILSSNQKRIIDILKHKKMRVAVVRSVDEAMVFLREWGVIK